MPLQSRPWFGTVPSVVVFDPNPSYIFAFPGVRPNPFNKRLVQHDPDLAVPSVGNGARRRYGNGIPHAHVGIINASVLLGAVIGPNLVIRRCRTCNQLLPLRTMSVKSSNPRKSQALPRNRASLFESPWQHVVEACAKHPHACETFIN